MRRDEIPTPALLLDLDRFERNLARMAAHVRAAGKNIRPHAKTHRCPEIARRQIAAGALGVACAKLGEAEVMAPRGHPRPAPHHAGRARGEDPALHRAGAAGAGHDGGDGQRRERGGRRSRRRGGRRDHQRAGGRRRGHAGGRASSPASRRWRWRAGSTASRALRLRGLQGYAGTLRARHGLEGPAGSLARGAGALSWPPARGSSRPASPWRSWRAGRRARTTSTPSWPGSPSCSRAPTA